MTRTKHLYRPATKSASPVSSPSGSSAASAICFGTSGWRGILGEEVTHPRLRVLIRSVADWIREEDGGDRVLIGWDGRFASESMARTAAGLLVEAGLRPTLATGRTPTPAITHALSRRRCAAGLVLTASHNPADYHGLKVFGPSGGSIVDAHARRIESIAADRMNESAEPVTSRVGRRFDFNGAYSRDLSRLLDSNALRHSGINVVYDAMHGAGGGVLDRVLEEAGVSLIGVRLEPDPRFGGSPPDPSAEHLTRLAKTTKRTRGLRVGLATDGDGDRVGVVDEAGRILSETQVMSVLVDHLAVAGRVRRGVALTAGTGSLVEKVARHHGLPVERFPIGFKHLSAAIQAGRADVACEESGGFALASMGCDKDGILAGCLLVNLVATSGVPLAQHVARLEGAFGASACGRAAIARNERLDRALDGLTSSPPDRVGRARVVEVDNCAGLRLQLSDGGFMMLRRSGTEPVMRVYAEARDSKALRDRLRQGSRLLERAARAT